MSITMHQLLSRTRRVSIPSVVLPPILPVTAETIILTLLADHGTVLRLRLQDWAETTAISRGSLTQAGTSPGARRPLWSGVASDTQPRSLGRHYRYTSASMSAVSPP